MDTQFNPTKPHISLGDTLNPGVDANASTVDAPRKRYSTTELFRCAERELNLRKTVYPQMIKTGKMKRRDAEYELGAMEAIYDHFKELAAKEHPQLFQ